MCLYISKKHHKSSDLLNHDLIKSKKFAEIDIVVYKVLSNYGRGDTKWFSPYQRKHYTFGHLYKDKIFPDEWNDSIGYGLHSWKTYNSANSIVRDYFHRRVFFAIIPKGSEIWIGKNDDLVSNQLIVYESRKTLERVHGTIGVGRMIKDVVKKVK